jgi:hypothetical protein
MPTARRRKKHKNDVQPVGGQSSQPRLGSETRTTNLSKIKRPSVSKGIPTYTAPTYRLSRTCRARDGYMALRRPYAAPSAASDERAVLLRSTPQGPWAAQRVVRPHTTN